MIILISLIIIILFGIWLSTRYSSEFTGWLIVVFSTLYLFIHSSLWIASSFEYKSFIAKRDAFEQTLQSARLSNNPYESAAIIKEVAEWNVELAKLKYQNTIFFAKDYIDDRIDELELIK